MMVVNDLTATLQAVHTDAVIKAVKRHERNVVLDGRPPSINNSEKDLTRKACSTLAQLIAGYCGLLQEQNQEEYKRQRMCRLRHEFP